MLASQLVGKNSRSLSLWCNTSNHAWLLSTFARNPRKFAKIKEEMTHFWRKPLSLGERKG